MRKIGSPADELVERYQRATVRYLAWGKPTTGPKNARCHLVIHDREMWINGYSELLCGAKTGKVALIAGSPATKQEHCPKCVAALNRLAAIVANGHNPDLYAQAGVGGQVRVSKVEVKTAIRVLRDSPEGEVGEFEQLGLPVEMLPVGTGDYVAVTRDDVKATRQREKGPVIWPQ